MPTNKELQEALLVAARALRIAADHGLVNVQVNPPRKWHLEAYGEEVSEGWCSVDELAEKLEILAK